MKKKTTTKRSEKVINESENGNDDARGKYFVVKWRIDDFVYVGKNIRRIGSSIENKTFAIALDTATNFETLCN